MKEQYVGDVSDYRKYALLRALSDGGRNRIGVCWMFTPPDGRTDGNRTQYLADPGRWRDYDPPLFDFLASIALEDDPRRLDRIERSGIVPGATFFDRPLSDDKANREAYFDEMLARFADRDLIFFDPDNGLDIRSVPKGRRNSSKFLYRDEALRAFDAGHSLLIYQHFTRERRDLFVDRLVSDLAALIPTAEIWTYRTPHVLFMLVVQEGHLTLSDAAVAVVRRWDGVFLAGAKSVSNGGR